MRDNEHDTFPNKATLLNHVCPKKDNLLLACREIKDKKQDARIKGNLCIFCEGSNLWSKDNNWRCLDCCRYLGKKSKRGGRMEIKTQPIRKLSYLSCGCVKERNGETLWECKRHRAENA